MSSLTSQFAVDSTAVAVVDAVAASAAIAATAVISVEMISIRVLIIVIDVGKRRTLFTFVASTARPSHGLET